MKEQTVKAIARIGFIVILLSFLGASAHAEIVITMRLDPESTLPSLPVTLVLNVANPDSAAVRLLNNVRLEVTPSNGEPFLATWDRSETETGFTEESEPIVVPAGATRELYVAFDQLLTGPQFFWDPRLSRPGRYLVRALVAPVSPDGAVRTVATNSVPLEIRTPTNDDAAVYAFLLSIDPNWSGRNWAEISAGAPAKIVQTYPRSNYVPYVQTISGLSVGERLDVIEKALGRSLPDLIRDYYLLLTKARLLASRSNEITSRDVSEVVADARAAREILNRLIKTSPYHFVRTEAEEVLKHVKDPKDIPGFVSWYRDSLVPAPQAISPFVECIDRLGTTLVARFGYTNQNSSMKFLEIGPANRVEPTDKNLSPLRYFAPGRVAHATSGISPTGHPVSWYLDGNVAVATQDTSLCDPAATATIRPVLECVRHDNQGVVATFGYENPNRFALVIPIGDANQFDHKADRGQPQIFYPGRHKHVFKTKVKDTPATWTLGSKSVTATPRDSPACAD